MVLRSALLYLSRQHRLKDVFAGIPGFANITRRFIAGETIEAALEAVAELNSFGLTASFDHLGENISSREEAEHEVEQYRHVLAKIQESGAKANVSVKLTQLGLDFDEAFCLHNARQIVEAAARYSNFVRIDMEDSPKTDATLRIFYALRAEFENVGIVLQSYLFRTAEDLKKVLNAGGRVRLCKGAYAEPASVAFPEKADVDRNFVELAQTLLSSGIYHGIATHDEAMISATRAYAEKNNIDKTAFEFQMLYGVRRDLQIKLREEGYLVRVYVPFGAFWYPYFMRRLAERPANVLFILRNLFKG